MKASYFSAHPTASHVTFCARSSLVISPVLRNAWRSFLPSILCSASGANSPRPTKMRIVRKLKPRILSAAKTNAQVELFSKELVRWG